MLDEEDHAYINFLKVVHGAIVQAHNVEVVKRMDEEKDEILISVIYDLRKRFGSDANEILVPFQPAIGMDQVKFVVPVRGDKQKLVVLSMRNAASYRADRLLARSVDRKAEHEDKLLNQLKEDLRLTTCR